MEKIKCDKCNDNAIIYLAYGKHNFCKNHFNYFFEKRFKKTIREFKLIDQKDYLGIATSGGKDSMVLLYLINKIYGPRKLKFCSIFIDEGTPGYSNLTKDVVVNFCKENNIKLIIGSHKEEFGKSTADVAKKYDRKKGSICTYCGVMRRGTINKFANKEKVTKVVTGHNLDDESQTILMNLMDNDFIKFIKTGPIAKITKVIDSKPRIKPFYLTPEKEIAAYALFNDIPFHHCSCPFFRAAKRNNFRNFINETEVTHPGSKFGLIKSFLNIKNRIDNNTKDKLKTNNKLKTKNIKRCKKCGVETSGEICKACQLLETL